MVFASIDVPINEEIAYSPAARAMTARIIMSGQIKDLERHMAKYDCELKNSEEKLNGFPKKIILTGRKEDISLGRITKAYNEFWEIINKKDQQS